jgi:hypothetical protein
VLGSGNGSSFSQIVGSAGYTFNPSTGNTVTIGLPSGTCAQYLELNFTGDTGWDAAQHVPFSLAISITHVTVVTELWVSGWSPGRITRSYLRPNC